MYLVERAENTLTALEAVSFSSQQLYERAHLQEWLAANPSALGEPLLILQKEFARFEGTGERLDLLALDRQGNLVIIENKTDDSGRDATWQAIKYASYCASLTTPQIVRLYQEYLDKYHPTQTAEERLAEFIEGGGKGTAWEKQLNQGSGIRLILVAGRFRREVTNAVLWLLKYNIRLQCFQVTLFKLNEQLLLQIEQIIPLRQTREYTIELEREKQEETQLMAATDDRQQVLRRFWDKLLPVTRRQIPLFNNVTANGLQYLTAGSGIALVVYSFTLQKNSASVLLNFARAQASQNEFLYNRLLQQKIAIEAEFKGALTWENNPNLNSCKISCSPFSAGYGNLEQWDDLVTRLAATMTRLETAVKGPLLAAGNAMNTALPADEETGESSAVILVDGPNGNGASIAEEPD